MTTERKHCGNCVFYALQADGGNRSRCLVDPPQVFDNGIGAAAGRFEYVQPEVEANRPACRHWQPFEWRFPPTS